MSSIPTEQDVLNLVKERGGKKFSKLEAVYTSPAFPPEGPEISTGLPFNYVQGLNVVCERCVFYVPPAPPRDPALRQDGQRFGTCKVVGLATDWGGEQINPKGLSRFFIAKEPRLIDKSLQSVYIPEVTLRKLLGLR